MLALETRMLFDGAIAPTADFVFDAPDDAPPVEPAAMAAPADAPLAAPPHGSGASSIEGPSAGFLVSEPSELGDPGADTAALSGWTVRGEGTLTVVVSIQPDGSTGVSASAGSLGGLTDGGGVQSYGDEDGVHTYVLTGDAATVQGLLNSITFTAADVELGKTAAKVVLTVDGGVDVTEQADILVAPANDPARLPETPAGQDIVEGNITDPETGASDAEGTVITGDAFGLEDPELERALLTDPDLAGEARIIAEQIVYRVESAPDHGYLTLEGNRLGEGSIFTHADVLDGKVRYVHDPASPADQNTNDGFDVRVNDGATPLDPNDLRAFATIALRITPVNQAPVVGGTGWVYEGQPGNAQDMGGQPLDQVGDWIRGAVSAGGDPLGGGEDGLAADSIEWIQFTQLPGHGEMRYTGIYYVNGVEHDTADLPEGVLVLDGSHIDGGAASLGAGGIPDGFALRMGDVGGLTYLHDGSEPAGPNAATQLGIRAWDQGGGEKTEGGDSLPKSSDGVIGIAIRPVNDDPVLGEAGREATVDEASNTVQITADMLPATDPDSDPGQITFVIQTSPEHGVITVNGTVLGEGGAFTLDDVENNRVLYTQYSDSDPAEGVGGQDGFKFHVVDNALSLRWDASGEAFERMGGVYEQSVAGEDNLSDPLKTFDFTLNLVDMTGPGGGDMPEPVAIEGDVSTQTGSLAEGGALALDSDLLDYPATLGGVALPSEQIVYTYKDVVTGNGALQRYSGSGDRNDPANWQTLDPYATFTQKDVDEGNIRFEHDGNEVFKADVSLSVSTGQMKLVDGKLVADSRDLTLNFDITPVNDKPVVQVGRDVTVIEGGAVVLGLGELSIIDPDDFDSTGSLGPGQDTGGFAEDHDESNPLKFAVSTDDLHGTLRYSIDGGATWIDVVLSPDSDNLHWIDYTTTDGVKPIFQYEHDGSETVVYDNQVSFKVYAMDRHGAMSDPDGTGLTIHLTAVNDQPQINQTPVTGAPSDLPDDPNQAVSTGVDDLAPPATPTANVPIIVQESGKVQITPDALQAYDPDSSASQVQYTITKAPPAGSYLAYSASGDGTDLTPLGKGSAFSQDDVNNGRIWYVHGGAESPGNDRDLGVPGVQPDEHFEFRLSDSDKEWDTTGDGDVNFNEFWVYVDPANDPPKVTAPGGGPVVVDGDGATPVGGFTVEDPDLINEIKGGEQDFIHVTVRLLDKEGNPVPGGPSAVGATFSHGLEPTDPSALYDLSTDAQGNLLIQGTRAEVNAMLAGLAVEFDADQDKIYQIEVIADDRMRDDSGALIVDGDGNGIANGGELNQAAKLPGELSPVSGADPSWATGDKSVAEYLKDPANADLKGNISAATVVLWASSINDTPELGVPDTTADPLEVYEDQWTTIPGITVSDVESSAFGTDVELTLSVTDGTLRIEGGSSKVSITGDGTPDNPLILTGTVEDIQALLGIKGTEGAPDVAGKLQYRSPANGNHDYNGSEVAGDVTLTVELSDSLSKGSSDIGQPDPASGPAELSKTIALNIVAVNDAPLVNADSGVVIVVGSTPVPGFSVDDLDIADPDDGSGDRGGVVENKEEDFIQVTVRLVTDAGEPLGAADYEYVMLDSIVDDETTWGGIKDATHNGEGGALIIRGTREQVNEYLNGLRIQITDGDLLNQDQSLKVQVIADDRLRNDDGALIVDEEGRGIANGGFNEKADGGTETVPLDDVDGGFDPYIGKVGLGADALKQNIGFAERDIFPTGTNDPATIDGNVVTDGAHDIVPEADGSYALSGLGITIGDQDALDTDLLTVTITLDEGFSFKGNGGDADDPSKNASVDDGGTDQQTITLTGTQEQINAHIQTLIAQLPDPDGDDGPASVGDWNGDFTVKVEVNDRGNNGAMPDEDYLADFKAQPGQGVADYTIGVKPRDPEKPDDPDIQALITTREFTVRVTPTNDAPTLDGDKGDLSVTESGTTTDGVTVGPIPIFEDMELGDVDLHTTAGIGGTDALPDDGDVFGAGSIEVEIGDFLTGDQLGLATGEYSSDALASMSYDEDTGVMTITLTESATIGEVQAIIEAIRYSSTNENPTANDTQSDRTFTLTVHDDKNAQKDLTDPLQDADAGGPGSLSATFERKLTITPDNDKPVMDLNGNEPGGDATVTWTEGADVDHEPGLIFTDVTLSDVDNDRYSSVDLELSGIQDGNGEILSVDGEEFQLGTSKSVDKGGYTIAYVADPDGGAGTLSISVRPGGSLEAGGAAADFENVLKSITYINNSQDPTGGDRVITVTTTDAGRTNDATATDAERATSDPVTLTLTVVPMNDRPSIDGLDATSPNATATNPYQQGDTAGVVIDPDVTFDDPELGGRNDGDGNWGGATLTIGRATEGGVDGITANPDDVFGTNGSEGTGVLLGDDGTISVDGATIGTYTNTDGQLQITFNENATTALVNQAAQGITYANAKTVSETLDTNVVTLAWVLDDQNPDVTNGGSAGAGANQGGGGHKSAFDTIDLHINRPPIANPDAYEVDESDGPATLGNVLAGTGTGEAVDTDPDGDALKVVSVTVTVDGVPTVYQPGDKVPGSHGGEFTIGEDGTITFDPKGEFVTLNPGESRDTSVSYTIRDEHGQESTTTATVTVNGENTPIVPTPDVDLDPVADVDGNTITPIETAHGFFDPDEGDTREYSASGLPDGLEIDPETGKITGTLHPSASQDGDDPGNEPGVYTVIVTVKDSGGETATQTLTITVTNPPPVAHPDVDDVLAGETVGRGGNGVIGGLVPGAGDVDPDGDPLHVIGVIPGDNAGGDAGDVQAGGGVNVGEPLRTDLGTLTLNEDGSYRYVADGPSVATMRPGEVRLDVFTYAISDGEGGLDYTTLTIRVTAPVPVTGEPYAPPSPPLRDAWVPPPALGGMIGGAPPLIWGLPPHEHTVMNLPIPLQPVVYVEVTVQAEQDARRHMDWRGWGSDPSQAILRDSNLSSQTRGLGMDPVLYVQHEVDAAQREAAALFARTMGREGRIALSADGGFGSNLLRDSDPTLQWSRPGVPGVDSAEDEADGSASAADVPEGTPADGAPEQAAMDGGDADGATPGAGSSSLTDAAPGDAMARLGAPTFTEQLRLARPWQDASRTDSSSIEPLTSDLGHA